MKTILCPTDFSACSDNALVYATQLAIQAQAKVILLHTLFTPDAIPYGGISIHPQASFGEIAQLQDMLIHITQNLKQQTPHAQVDYEIKVGGRPVVDEITHVANTEQADLIVMGTSGAHGLKEILLGSTTASVIEMTRRPVLVIPQTVTFRPIKQIVFAADLTRDHPANLAEVISLARLFEAQISFLHVLQDKSFATDSLAKIQFGDLYARIDYGHVSFHTQEDTDIQRGILTFSHQINADLIVMVNHNRSLMESIFKGSETKKLAYHSPIPLLAIHNH